MPRRVQILPVAELIEQIDAGLRAYHASAPGLTLREKVLRLAEAHHKFRSLGVSVAVDSGLPRNSGLARALAYLRQHVGIVIDSVELDVVSGISEFGRRIRQLRKEDGYKIVSGASADTFSGVDLRPDQYMLIDPEPDLLAARRWHTANRIRKSGGGSQSRILEFLKENVGQVVTTEELAYVSKDRHEFGRRTRELRTEQGYAVATRFTGRPDLLNGEYILQSLDRIAPEHDRNIPEPVQKIVYARDNNTCRNCGWNRDLWTRQDPRFLELHHLQHHAHGGQNIAENLIVLCSKCHDDVHAKRINIDHLVN